MIKVLKKGFYSTIQDLGRFGYRDKGVPVSGVMDTTSALLANALLNNDPNDAVMEITMAGPKLEFHTKSKIVITGANMNAHLNDKSLENNRVVRVEEGDIVSFGTARKGFRAYLAVKGGFQTDKILGSRAFYKPLTKENKIMDGMILPIKESLDISEQGAHIGSIPSFGNTLKVYKGPEFSVLENEGFFHKEFTVANEHNRMAYQLEELLSIHQDEMLTSATLPGTVQYTPSGKLIILMRDAQTTGGYPRVLQLTEEAIGLLAQKRTGDKLYFSLI